MDKRKLLEDNKKKIIDIANKYNASNIRVFGSVARGEYDDNSDIDFLVDYSGGVGLLGHFAFQRELEDLLGVKVDIVSEKALKDRIRNEIISEAVSL